MHVVTEGGVGFSPRQHYAMWRTMKAARARLGVRDMADNGRRERREKSGERRQASETVWGYAASISRSLYSKNWNSSWIRLHSTQTKSFGYSSLLPLYRLNFPRQCWQRKLILSAILFCNDLRAFAHQKLSTMSLHAHEYLVVDILFFYNQTSIYKNYASL